MKRTVYILVLLCALAAVPAAAQRVEDWSYPEWSTWTHQMKLAYVAGFELALASVHSPDAALDTPVGLLVAYIDLVYESSVGRTIPLFAILKSWKGVQRGQGSSEDPREAASL